MLKQKISPTSSLLTERLYNSLAQALIRIYNGPNIFLRAYLFTVVVATSGLASYLVIQTVTTYFAYEVITTSRSLFETPTLFQRVRVKFPT